VTDSNETGDDVYQEDVERQWSEATSIQGVSPELLDDDAPTASANSRREPSAALSPWLIPFSAILTGPLVATLLTLFTDGDPPTGRQAIAVLSTGLTAWVVNMGLGAADTPMLSPVVESAIRLGVLLTAGIGLWAMYTYWMKGKQGVDRSALLQSAIVLVVLSGLFWFGRSLEPVWWSWLGR